MGINAEVDDNESSVDIEDTPEAQYKYWADEIKASKDMLQDWQKEGDRIEARYVDDRKIAAGDRGTTTLAKFRLNLFNSNVKTLTSMLYSRLPKVEADRRNNSQNDDVGRVAAETVQRLLTLDLADNGNEYDAVFRAVLQDRLLPGVGCARVRYEFDSEEIDDDNVVYMDGVEPPEAGEDAEPAQAPEMVTAERAPIDYYHWSDMLWGWARTFSTVPWIAFRSYLTKAEVKARFSEEIADDLTYKKQTAYGSNENPGDKEDTSEVTKAEIWEIWDKDRKKVIWLSKDYDKTLDSKDDPLGLSGFYPCPPFFMANQTTTIYRPTSDYHMAQDLYNEIDVLQTRIAIITEAVKVVGVYNADADGVQRMMNEGVENDLIPIDNWALFAEQGGIQGAIDWLPLADIVAALDKLRTLRDESIVLLQQITGMADVMRGSLDNQYEGVGQTEIKKEFGSLRVQSLQEEFAVFVTNLMQLKAEVIARHFSPESIVKQSNMEFAPQADIKIMPQAVQLIKTPELAHIRIIIRSETMAMLDYAKLREERTSYLNGLSTFLQAASPLIQQDERSLPFLLQMLKWAMAGYKGSSEIEGVLDEAIETMSQPEQQKEPEKSPEQERMDSQIKLEEMRQQGKQQENQQKHQQDMELRSQDMQMDVQTREAEANLDMQKDQNKANLELQVISAKFEADVQTELLTSQINAEQQDKAVQAQIEADLQKSRNKIEEIKVAKRADAGIKVVEKKLDGENQRNKPPTGGT